VRGFEPPIPGTRDLSPANAGKMAACKKACRRKQAEFSEAATITVSYPATSRGQGAQKSRTRFAVNKLCGLRRSAVKGEGVSRPGYTEAKKVAPARGAVPAAAGRAEVLRRFVPRTAADDAARAVSLRVRRTGAGLAIKCFPVAVFRPLPDIAMHVVEPECVRCREPGRLRSALLPLLEYATVLQSMNASLAVAPSNF